MRASIPELLSRREQSSASLNVLRPLAVQNAAEVEEKGAGWVASIERDPALDARQRETLIDLLVKFLIQRFTELPYEEIFKMLQLTPLEDTRAYRELTQIGRKEGREEGRLDGLQMGIRAVLHRRFPHATTEELVTALTLAGGVKDEAMLQVLLEEATDTDSLVEFQQQAREMQDALASLRRRASMNE